MLLGANAAGAELAALRLEVSILSRARHPNIVRIYGCNLGAQQASGGRRGAQQASGGRRGGVISKR